MADSKLSPSLFPNSKNEASENTPSKIRLVETPAPSHPSLGREISIPHHEAKDDMTPCVFKRDEFNSSMKFILIEIPPGNDIPETLINIARQRNANLTVLSGFGPVSNINLLNPVSHAPYLPIQGPLEMFSLSGSHLITNPIFSSFVIFLSSVSGQVVGEIIGGKVMTAGHVTITAILFKNPYYHKVVSSDEKNEDATKEDEGESIAAVIINANQASADPNDGNNN